MESSRRQVVSDDGTEISYLVFAGVEPALVILHGLAGSSREFVATADAFVGRKIILIDQRGHGHSTRLPSDLSRAAFVSDALRVIETESSVPIDLAGQSMGAHTAMLVASARPDLVRKLVLLEGNEGTGSPDSNAAMGEYFRSWQVPFTTLDEARSVLGDGALANAWIADLEDRGDGLYPRFDPDVMVATADNVSVPRWVEWEGVSAPTLVLYADGGMFSEAQKEQFAERRAGVTRIDLTNASHDAHLDAFDQWIDALSGFVAERK